MFINLIQSKLLVSSKDYYSCVLTKQFAVKVSIITINGDEGFGILESLTGDENPLQNYVQKLKMSNNILQLDITHQSPTVYWTRMIHRLDYPSIYETVLESGSMTLLPIIIESGVQTHTVLSPTPEAFKELLDKLKARFSTAKLKWLSSKPSESQSLLTAKQLEAFKLAYKSGYYEIPRRSNLTELAGKLGIKRVAMQERLRRVELRILTEYANNIQ